MATQTSNLGLTKPGYDEAADIVPAVNNNMDAIDAVMGAVPPNTSVQAQITANAQAIAKLDESIAIVSNGNTHAAIAAGQYVYIKGHETLAEGLYTANSAISANATLSNSNVTAVSGGGLNALNSKLEKKAFCKFVDNASNVIITPNSTGQVFNVTYGATGGMSIAIIYNGSSLSYVNITNEATFTCTKNGSNIVLHTGISYSRWMILSNDDFTVA